MRQKNFALDKELCEAARGGDLDAVKRLVQNDQFNPDAKDYNGTTALMLAAENGHSEVVEVLINAKADVHAVDENNNTALKLAAKGNHTKVLKVLVESFSEDLRGEASKEASKEVLRWIVVRRDINSMRSFVENLPQDANRVEVLSEGLISAAWWGNLEFVKELLEAGADVNAVNDYSQTALMAAAGEGREKVVEELLEAGADVNAVNDYSQTALMLAARKGCADVVEELLEAGADVKAEQYGKTALQMAVEAKKLETVRVFVKKLKGTEDYNKALEELFNLAAKEGGVLEIVNVFRGKLKGTEGYAEGYAEDLEKFSNLDDSGNEALEIVNMFMQRLEGTAGYTKALEEALRAAGGGNLEVVNMFMKSLEDTEGYTAALEEALRAAGGGSLKVVEVLIKKLPEDSRVKTLNKAFRLAAKNLCLGVVKKLLDVEGIDVNEQDSDGNTALMLAAERGSVIRARGVLEVLYGDERVNVNAQNNDGKTALMHLCSNSFAGCTLILEFMFDGSVFCKKKTNFIRRTINLNLQDSDGNTALMLAAGRGNKAAVEALIAKKEDVLDGSGEIIQKKIDLGMTNKDGKTALMLAVEEGKAEVVKVLIDAKADVHAVDNHNNTALKLAAEKGNKAIVLMLVKADVTAEDKAQALMLAVEEVHEDVVRVLIENLPEDSRVETLNKALVLAKDDSIKSLLEQHVSNATPKSVRVNAEVSGTGSGSLGASKNETSKGAPSYPKTQRALCLASATAFTAKGAPSYPKTQLALCLTSAAAFTSGAYFLLAQSAVSTMMWGPVPVLYLALVGCAAVGALLGLALTTAYKDGFNDVAHSFYNWLGIAQDGQSTAPSV
jgi:ankyrin repeat protein